MKKFVITVCAVLLLLCTACTESSDAQLNYRFADAEEGVSLITSNTEYFENFSQEDLNYRLQKKDATLEEWLDFASQQVLEFSEEEKNTVDTVMNSIEDILSENGYTLPELDEIVFVKTTMREECGPAAYTHKTHIYLSDALLKYWSGQEISDNSEKIRPILSIMCHEIFHCLTRSDPQFRAAMYEILGFTVQEEEFELSDDIRERAISNPDVGHRDSYAAFTINGEKINCFTVWVNTKPFEQAGDSFFDYQTTALVPIDDTSTMYTMEDASDFWEVFGRNTNYVTDPEECLADNFGYALAYGLTDRNGEAFQTPEIIEAIQSYLKG